MSLKPRSKCSLIASAAVLFLVQRPEVARCQTSPEDDCKAFRVNGFRLWRQLNRPFYYARQYHNGKPVFSDITLTIVAFWGYWADVPSNRTDLTYRSYAGNRSMNVSCNGTNASNLSHLDMCLCMGNVSNMSNCSARMQARAEAEELIAAFRVLDRDGNGYITAVELGRLMMNPGDAVPRRSRPFTEKEVLEVLREIMARERDGRIYYQDLQKLMRKRKGTYAEQQLTKAVEGLEQREAFGNDTLKSISPAELRGVLTNLGEALTAKEMDGLIQEADGDGWITYAEFVAMKKWLLWITRGTKIPSDLYERNPEMMTVFKSEWVFAPFGELGKERPFMFAHSSERFIFPKQAWSERLNMSGSEMASLRPTVECVVATCHRAPRHVCKKLNREPCGGDVTDTCGRCITGHAGEDGGSNWRCSAEGTAGMTINFQEHKCSFMRFTGFNRHSWLNSMELVRSAQITVGQQATWFTPEKSAKGVAVYFCEPWDVWAVTRLKPQAEAGSWKEQVQALQGSPHCPFDALLGDPHPTMPGVWMEAVHNGDDPWTPNARLEEANGTRMRCSPTSRDQPPEWKGRCPTCVIMPKWWFCDGGCEALSLLGLFLGALMLLALCLKFKLCKELLLKTTLEERERAVKLGLTDVNHKDAPHHMRIAKNTDQRLAVRFFGRAHPDHTIKPPVMQALRDIQGSEKKQQELAEHKTLHRKAKPSRMSNFKAMLKDTMAEPTTEVQKIHPMMCTLAPPEHGGLSRSNSERTNSTGGPRSAGALMDIQRSGTLTLPSPDCSPGSRLSRASRGPPARQPSGGHSPVTRQLSGGSSPASRSTIRQQRQTINTWRDGRVEHALEESEQAMEALKNAQRPAYRASVFADDQADKGNRGYTLGGMLQMKSRTSIKHQQAGVAKERRSSRWGEETPPLSEDDY